MRHSPRYAITFAVTLIATGWLSVASQLPSQAGNMQDKGLVTLVQGVPGKSLDFYLNETLIASNVAFGRVVGPLSEPPRIQMASIRLAGSPSTSPALSTIRVFIASNANQIFQSSVTASGAVMFTTFLPPSLLPPTARHSWVQFWNGTSTPNIDIYRGSITSPHPLVDTLPINNRSATPQPWCHNSCYDGGIDFAPGTYVFTTFQSKTKTSPLVSPKSLAVQPNQIYIVDYIGSAVTKPSSAVCLVLHFGPTTSLSSL
jgi:hypothetical protein